ncbi:hypothetical protein RUM44_009495 [Polyplax serrata]
MFRIFPLIFIVLYQRVIVCDNVNKEPTIFVALFARNKEITLPYFLWLFEKQDYPKDRISLWIKSDHNIDGTVEILETWLSTTEHLYHSVDVSLNREEIGFPNEKGPVHWTNDRFQHMIQLREEALIMARKKWADFILFLDCDAFLTNNQTLKYLVTQNMTVTAPMLKSVGFYSNFWCGMTDKYYYLRTDDYQPILKNERKGCFNVPMIHSAVMINLRKEDSDYLTYNSSNVENYNGPVDDIITFALSANQSGVGLHICNEEQFGYVMLPLESHEPLIFDRVTLTNLKVEMLIDNPPLQVSDIFLPYLPTIKADKMGFDQIYMINLKRRPERRVRMVESFKELGMDVVVFDAVDGR